MPVCACAMEAPAVTLKHKNTGAPAVVGGVPLARLNVVEAGTVLTAVLAGTSAVPVVPAAQPNARAE